MARNMKEANMRIFSMLRNYVEDYVKENKKDTHPEGLYIRTNNKDKDKEWLKHIKIVTKEICILPSLKTAMFTFKDKHYFVVVGLASDIPFNNEVLSKIDMNAGIYTALLSDSEIKIRKGTQPVDIYNILLLVEGRKYKGSKYEGHDLDDILPYFEPVSVYEIKEQSPIDSKDIYRISGLFIVDNKENVSLSYSDDSLTIYRTIFLEGSDRIPIENITFSLVAVKWQHSFLDIYRCIESLFSIVYLDKLYSGLKIEDKFMKFVEIFEHEIGWKPKEEDAIRSIFKEMDDKIILKDARCFYNIRNQIVHLRALNKENIIDKFKDEDWDSLIYITLLLVKEIYGKYENRLM
ncbi:hypothetical protein MCHI_002762 [Candidatus Magnetoovum chiemensis]|nr:hypothetical protein MCHI_002762 [Candidatus Magnetoovum chiemensis]